MTALDRTVRAALLVCGAMYVLHFVLLAPLVGPYDYNHLSTYYELAWRFWTTQSGLPHFNPFFCGGRTLGADPQVPVFHPLVLLVATVGPAAALKVEMLAQLVLGVCGLSLWLKRWGMDRPSRLWGCLLFIGGGFTVARFMVGHVTLGFYWLAPLYFYLSYRAGDPRSRLKVGSLGWLILLCTYSGFYKPNFFIYWAPCLAAEAGLRAWYQRSAKPLTVFCLAIGLAGLLCAVTLLPSALYFREFPRLADSGPKRVPWHSLLANLMLPLKAIPGAWYGPDFMQRHEYSVFLGPFALGLAAIGWGRLRNHPAEQRALLGFALFGALVGVGAPSHDWGPLPFSWLQNLWPGFESVRVPVRFWFCVYLAAIVWSAAGYRQGNGRCFRRAAFFLAILPLVAQTTVNLGKVSVFASQWQWNPERKFPTTPWHRHAEADTPYTFTRQGDGVLECVQNLEALQSPLLREDAMLSARPDRPLWANAKWVGWSQIELSGHASLPSTVSLNMNHHPYWAITGGDSPVRIESEAAEPLALTVPAGTFSATLRFRQPGVWWGALISLLTATICVALWIYGGRKRLLRIGLTGGIGSGKSEVGALLRARGWHWVDLDALARDLTTHDPATLETIRSLFGESVFTDGKIDRKALRQKVFEDSTLRKQLEQWLHPKVMAKFEEQARTAAKAGAHAIVCEGALLVEAGYKRRFHKLITVSAPTPTRLARICQRDACTQSQARAILAAQADDAAKLVAADRVLDNSGTLKDTEVQITWMARDWQEAGWL